MSRRRAPPDRGGGDSGDRGDGTGAGFVGRDHPRGAPPLAETHPQLDVCCRGTIAALLVSVVVLAVVVLVANRAYRSGRELNFTPVAPGPAGAVST